MAKHLYKKRSYLTNQVVTGTFQNHKNPQQTHRLAQEQYRMLEIYCLIRSPY